MLAALGQACEINFRTVAREFPEIVYEVRLVVIAAFVGDVGQRLAAAVMIKRGLKTRYTRIKLWCESGKFLKTTLERAVRHIPRPCEPPYVDTALLAKHLIDRSRDGR